MEGLYTLWKPYRSPIDPKLPTCSFLLKEVASRIVWRVCFDLASLLDTKPIHLYIKTVDGINPALPIIRNTP